MKTLAFAKRTDKEILRDPLTLFFGLGFPVILLLLLSAIQANIPVEIFAIEQLAPGMTVFGLSFMTLFSATLIAKDRESAFLQRLYATPMTALNFILGYTLPVLPIALAQCAVCFAVAIVLGLPATGTILLCLLFILPISVVFIGLGLLCGSVLNQKQVGGICGALLTNLTAWFSGIWFDLNLVGGGFKKLANVLPFVHGVELERAVLQGNYTELFPHLLWVLGYAVAIFCIAVIAFLRQMRKG